MTLCNSLQGCDQCPVNASPCWLSLGLHLPHVSHGLQPCSALSRGYGGGGGYGRDRYDRGGGGYDRYDFQLMSNETVS